MDLQKNAQNIIMASMQQNKTSPQPTKSKRANILLMWNIKRHQHLVIPSTLKEVMILKRRKLETAETRSHLQNPINGICPYGRVQCPRPQPLSVVLPRHMLGFPLDQRSQALIRLRWYIREGIPIKIAFFMFGKQTNPALLLLTVTIIFIIKT